MSAFIQGIALGLTLSILMGPILFALLQASMEHGLRAGLSVGLGIWISDLLYIVAVIFSVQYVQTLIEWEGFELWLGILGGIVLLVIGIFMFFGRSRPADLTDSNLRAIRHYSAFLTKGFLINTVNPFTVIFWFSVLSGYIASKGEEQILWPFVLGIFLTIVCTDSLKVILAKRIASRLSDTFIARTRKICGVALFLFGVGLFVRVFWF